MYKSPFQQDFKIKYPIDLPVAMSNPNIECDTFYNPNMKYDTLGLYNELEYKSRIITGLDCPP